MKTTITFFLLIPATTNISFSATHTITAPSSSVMFSPSSITINLGDTVNFVLASIHSAREVSQTTWDANGTTSNGGFDLPFGGGIVILTRAGIHYYVCVPHASVGMKGTITVNSGDDVKTMSGTIPDNFILMQNYPNPFNPTTTISFDIPIRSFVSLKVFDMSGKEVSTIVSGKLGAGNYIRQWDAVNMPSGIYFYRLQAGTYHATKKAILLK